MFQFPRFAFDSYEFRIKYLLLISANASPSSQTASQLQISKVGFPIRKSADQSLFAAPHGLSQRTTSFIASQRQGIHRIPLRHLIALITNAHRSAAIRLVFFRTRRAALAEKTSFASNTSESVAVKPRPRLRCSIKTKASSQSRLKISRSDAFPLHDVIKDRDPLVSSASRNSFDKDFCPAGDDALTSGGARRDRT